MSPSASPGKVCVVCGEDCSGRPRSKDKQGRYTCDACSQKRGASKSAATAVPSPASGVDDEVIPFLDEPSIAPKVAGRPCPACARPLLPEAMICMGCGHNLATGRAVATAIEAGEGVERETKTRMRSGAVNLQCKKCGYSLKGLKDLKCPECGTQNVLGSSKRDRDREESRRVARNAWISPIIMMLVGLCITSAIVGGAMGADAIAGHLVRFGISLVIGLAVFIFCSFLWIGFDEPLPMTALRMAGVLALADIGFTIVRMLPLGGFGMVGFGVWGVPTLIYYLLMTQIMEIDYEDAVIVAVVTTIAKIFLTMFIMSMIS